MYLLFRFLKVFRPCRNTNGYLRGVSPDDDNVEVSLCKLLQLSTPPLTALYFAVLKLRTLSSKGWVITEQTDVCWLAQVDYPNGFAASGPKKVAATKTCL